jgi:hypothetical protein
MIVLASLCVGVFDLLPLPLLKCRELHLLNYSDEARIYCNNTFIRALYVCDVLCIVTSVMTPRNDPDYD